MRQGQPLKPCSPRWHSWRHLHIATFESHPGRPVPLRVAMPASTASTGTTAGGPFLKVNATEGVTCTYNEVSSTAGTMVMELAPSTSPKYPPKPQQPLTVSGADQPSTASEHLPVAAAAADSTSVANNVVAAAGMQTAPIVVAPPAITPYAPDPGSAGESASPQGPPGHLVADVQAAPAAAVAVPAGAAGDARVSPSVPAVPAAVPVAAVCTEEDVSKETEGLGRGLPEQSSSAAQFSLSRSSPLAGGRLDVVHWREGRMLRIWTPPGFSPTSSSPSSSRDPLPVLYLNDGQNLYGDQPTLSGCSWHVGEAAAGLINSGALPPFVVVGIDHAGDKRSYDYLPYRPGTANGYRLDAANWPGGGVEAYLRAVVDEILPYTERTYGVSSEPALRGFGGSSFGGICALCAAMLHPGVFGALLVESPSLWFGEERLLRQDLPSFQGPWPARMFLAMGTKEYSGIRKETLTPEFDSRLVSLTHDLAALLESRGLMRGERLQLVIEEGATHTEAAWAGRLPAALSSLGLHWWRHVLSRCRDHLYFTFPRKLLAGRPAVLFFNQARSTALASRPRDSIKMSYGFNVDWSVGGGRIDMTPAVGLTALAAETRVGRATNGTSPLPAYDIVGDVAEAFHAADASSWLQATFTVPPEAYEMHMAFSDGDNGNWDNNDGANFYARVKMDMTAEQRSHTVEQAMAEGPAWGDVQEIAHKRSGSMYFTTPEFLVAGEPAVLYVNRHRVRGLEHSPNMRVHFGFNSWQVGGQEMCLKPSSLWRGEYTDWWSVPLTVPGDATDMSFALTDGHGVWDNNFGNNYMCPVKKARGTGGLVERRVEPRGVESEESMPHAAGTLHIVTLTKRKGGDTAVRANKWTEEKRVRVWTPPGFDPSRPPPGGYPVLYMQDGQNMFEDWLAHQGVSWRVGYTASDLITRGELPPFVVVAVDSVGAMRSLNYLPYPPGTGAGGFRGDAERWPGGGLEAYMGRLVEEIMPLIQQRFAVSSDPAKVAFGGGSFAGVAALYAAMHYPHVFGCVLAESPSLWIAEGRFLQDMRMYRGMLPERLFLGCGTKEYSATRDHDREDVDALLLSYCQEAASILESQGMRGNRLRFLVEEGAGHHELAWQWRLTGAMRFLFSAWWDE